MGKVTKKGWLALCAVLVSAIVGGYLFLKPKNSEQPTTTQTVVTDSIAVDNSATANSEPAIENPIVEPVAQPTTKPVIAKPEPTVATATNKKLKKEKKVRPAAPTVVEEPKAIVPATKVEHSKNKSLIEVEDDPKYKGKKKKNTENLEIDN